MTNTYYFTSESTDVSTVTVVPSDVNDQDISNILTYTKTIWFLVFFIIGIITNLLSFMVIVKQGLIKSSIWVYIAALSVSDNCTLINGFIWEFSKEPINLLGEVSAMNTRACKTSIALLYSLGATSRYILTAMTLGRCLMILRPYKQPSTQNQTLGYVFLIVIAIFLLYAPFLAITYDVIEIPIPMYMSGNTTEISFFVYVRVCSMLPQYSEFHIYFVWMDNVVYFIVPVIVILTSNFTIMFKLYQRSKMKHINRGINKNQEDLNITYMLITVSLFFIVCTTPLAIFNTIAPYIYSGHEVAYASDNVPWIISSNMQLVNYSCNFFLISASGKMFRNELKKFFTSVFKCLTKKKASGISDTSPHLDFPSVSTSGLTLTSGPI